MAVIKKPWGCEEIWAETENYVGKIITIQPGHRLSLQYHRSKEETIYVLDGVLRIWFSEMEDDYKDYSKGEVYHVAPGDVHRFGCPKNNFQVRIVEVSTNYLQDVVRLKDDYGRATDI